MCPSIANSFSANLQRTQCLFTCSLLPAKPLAKWSQVGFCHTYEGCLLPALYQWGESKAQSGKVDHPGPHGHSVTEARFRPTGLIQRTNLSTLPHTLTPTEFQEGKGAADTVMEDCREHSPSWSHTQNSVMCEPGAIVKIGYFIFYGGNKQRPWRMQSPTASQRPTGLAPGYSESQVCGGHPPA